MIIKEIVDGKDIEKVRDPENNNITLFRKLIKDKPGNNQSITANTHINLHTIKLFVADVAGLMLDECYRFEKEELIAEFKFLEDEKGKDGKRWTQ